MTTHSSPTPAAIRTVLRRLRRQIRWYVWFEGLGLAVAWVGLAYWVGLALDYLPVLAVRAKCHVGRDSGCC